ncbi:MAG: hypothetical protein M3430_09600 [Acidobacteriota bacterium]|nr:hypothetical protein [Acidobacteriota bacterium]
MNIKSENLEHLFIAEAAAVDEAIRRAVRHALLTHKRAGNSIASWKDGSVVIIPAEDIPVEEIEENNG